MINGGLAEWSNAPVLKTGRGAVTPFIRPNRMPAANLAARAEVCASAPAFNHTAEAMRSKQPRLYASAVSFPRMEKTQWTNEKNAAFK